MDDVGNGSAGAARGSSGLRTEPVFVGPAPSVVPRPRAEPCAGISAGREYASFGIQPASSTLFRTDSGSGEGFDIAAKMSSRLIPSASASLRIAAGEGMR